MQQIQERETSQKHWRKARPGGWGEGSERVSGARKEGRGWEGWGRRRLGEVEEKPHPLPPLSLFFFFGDKVSLCNPRTHYI